MADAKVTLQFEKGYIGHPYWPAMEKLINIQKESGMNRVRSVDRRAQALAQYLKAKGISEEQYADLVRQSERPFYTWEDVATNLRGRNPNEIVIPAHQLYGCLAEASRHVSRAQRLASPEQIRTVLQVSDFATGRVNSDGALERLVEMDGVFERFVTVKSGTGQVLSNQRALRSNPYIANFIAAGTVHLSARNLELEQVRNFLVYAGEEIGVGASRKMGWGRFRVLDFQAT